MNSQGSAAVGAVDARPAGAISTYSPWLLPAAVVAVLAIAWFSTLGLRALVSPDEGRYATLSLAMLQSGDWVTPRLNGLLYFEKPALQYWIGALAFKVLGVSEFSARVWPALAALLTTVAVGLTAARLWGRETGVRALVICGAMTWIIGNGLYLTLDSGLAFWLTLTLCAMLLAHRPGASPAVQRRWILLAWASMALAVLSKGLVGIVIPGAVLVLLCLWQRDMSWWRGMHWIAGLLVFFAIATPWFVVVSMRNPAFAEFFFIHEHFARYLTKVHRREGAWWYYVPLLLAGALPWTGALPWLAGRPTPAAGGAAGPGAQQVGAAALVTQRRVLLVWAGLVFVFFSLSGSKLPSYILPMFPALALLLALRLREANAAALRWQLIVPVLAWCLLLLVATQAHRFTGPNSPMSSIEPMARAVRFGAAIFLAGAVVAWLCLRSGRITGAVISVGLAHVLAMCLVLQSHDSFGQLKSAAAPARALAPYLDADTPVFAVRAYDQTLPFYLRRNVVLVEYVDEFELGQRIEPGKSLPSMDEFVQRWTQLSKGAAYMAPDVWQELQQRGVPMRIVYRDPRRVVVVKP